MKSARAVIEDVLQGWFNGSHSTKHDVRAASSEVLYFLGQNYVLTPKNPKTQQLRGAP